MDPSSSSSTEGTAAELAPKKPFLRRIFPFLLVVNFAVGGPQRRNQLKRRKRILSKRVFPRIKPRPQTRSSQQLPLPRPEAPKVALPPVPESRQRELFKWILEEKRKVKPGSPAEKKKLNEEKALLKKYIRAESIPNL
ncbi:unnamed protein product [Spirodela intermedia]|uniref:Uncharacterized protein n=1 Tax=Spirodela intermedia TaxID=51605 RepID=A0A7I8ISY2_SPIIN|nr:unnamed protein product [Spirodela intermedia]CAA6660923.1 unnamed protein product [Spirodela intermedia]